MKRLATTQKFLLTFLLLIGICHVVKSQNFAWAKSFGCWNLQTPASIVTDNKGNVYSTGYIACATDFNPGSGEFMLYPEGGTAAYISKLDTRGQFVWAKVLSGPGVAGGISILVDTVGSSYIIGNFKGAIDFDPGDEEYWVSPPVDNSFNMFICKLDSLGAFQWVKTIGNTYNGYVTAANASFDRAGNIYTTGYFGGTSDFDPGVDTFNLTAIGSDIFISKFDPFGNFVWAKPISGSGFYESGSAITIDDLGNSYTTGYFTETADFNPNAGSFNLTSAGDEDIFVLKLDSAGNFEWVRKYGGIDRDNGVSICLDKSGNVYTTGYFARTATFNNVSLVSKGRLDAFLSKIDPQGNLIWAKSIGGTSGQEGHVIICDQSEKIYLAGSFSETTDFDPSNLVFNATSINATPDIFVCRFDATGNFDWVRTMGGGDSDIPFAMTTDNVGNIYTTGYYKDSVDFDPGESSYYLYSQSAQAIFISKLSQSNTGLQDRISTIPKLNIYPNPNNGVFTVDLIDIGPIIDFCISDILGNIVYSSHNLTQSRFDLENQPNGYYFIQLKTENEIINQKMIIYK